MFGCFDYFNCIKWNPDIQNDVNTKTQSGERLTTFIERRLLVFNVFRSWTYENKIQERTILLPQKKIYLKEIDNGLEALLLRIYSIATH